MTERGDVITLEEFFAGRDPVSRDLYEALRGEIESLGDVGIRITKSQVAFGRRVAFAWAWMPGKYVRGDVAPLVLTVDLHRRDKSSRWKEIVEPRPGRFTHHLELRSTTQLDDEVRKWLREAWDGAE